MRMKEVIDFLLSIFMKICPGTASPWSQVYCITLHYFI